MATKWVRPKFYLGTRDTRWDPYPQREPVRAIAHDYQGFWERNNRGEWFKTPVSYNFSKEITEKEANEFPLLGDEVGGRAS